MHETPRTKTATLWALFWVFLKAGTFTFAGGLAMLPVIQREIVDKHKLMTAEDFLEYAALSQTLPGVIALNCACFVGRRAAGFAGMLAAGFGATFPAFALMLVATILLQFIPREGPVQGAFRGIRAASAALVLSAAFTLGKHHLKGVFAVVVMLCSFALVFLLGVEAPVVVVLAGAAGVAHWALSGKKKEKKPC